jgi:hypothetical protein
MRAGHLLQIFRRQQSFIFLAEQIPQPPGMADHSQSEQGSTRDWFQGHCLRRTMLDSICPRGHLWAPLLSSLFSSVLRKFSASLVGVRYAASAEFNSEDTGFVSVSDRTLPVQLPDIWHPIASQIITSFDCIRMSGPTQSCASYYHYVKGRRLPNHDRP